MANRYSGKFDLGSNILQIDIDKWTIDATFTDVTGGSTSFDIKVGDIIYLDASQDINTNTWLPKGFLRFVVSELDPACIDGYNFGGTIQWAMDSIAPIEPSAFLSGMIGAAGSMGAMYIPPTFTFGLSESLVEFARSMETDRLAFRLDLDKNQILSLTTNKEPKLGLPIKDGAFLVSTRTGQRAWKTVDPIDKGEKGAFGGVATLDESGKIPMQQIPADVQTDTFEPQNETEMLALPAQKGDIAIRSDISKTFILTNNPANVLDNWKALASSGTSGGGTTGGTASNATTANEAKRIQPFRPGATYSIGEMVVYDNLIWMARKGLFSVQSFNKDDWMLVAGNMDSYQYDSDGDGIVDRANHADDALYAMKSDLTRMIQNWMPNRQYTTGEQLVYGTEFYLVSNNFTSGEKFDPSNLIPMSLKKHSALLELQGGDKTLGEYYHLTAEKAAIINGLGTNNGKLTYGSQTFGDMLRLNYDSNGDGAVDRADSLTGVIVQNEDINSLQGIKGNVQSQIDTLKLGINIKGSINTYADLVSITGNLSDAYVVMEDETRLDLNGKPTQTLYIWNGSWTYLSTFTVQVRNFKTNPIDLLTESVGTLPESRIDISLARKTELHSHSNKGLLDSYTFTNADFYALKGSNHGHSNLDLLETYTLTNATLADTVSKAHNHGNSSVLNSFSKSSDGKLLFEGKLIEGSLDGGSGGSGITDLSNFTTNDLKDYTDKRYITDLQRDSISQLPSIKSTQAALDTKLNDIILKVPSNASALNKLVTAQDIADKVGVTKFKQLTDINPNFVPNAFVVVNPSGTGLTYLNKIDMKIQKITDMDGNIFTNVPYLSFKDIDANLLSDGQTVEFSIPKLSKFYSTDILDMPKSFTGANGKVLIANETGMKYEFKDIKMLTNSHANYFLEVSPGDWTYNSGTGKYEKIVPHMLSSTNLIVAFYDDTAAATTVPYRILDANQILLSVNQTTYVKAVVNCSQGTTGDGSGGGSSSSSGNIIPVTADTFIDDSRTRLDKTFSSQRISDVLASYAKKTNIYTKAEADALFATINTMHIHANLDALNKLSMDSLGNPMFNNKPLLTSITSATYQNHWTNQDNSSALSTVVDVFNIYSSQKFGTILSNEFTVKNVKPSVDQATDSANMLRLVVVDGTITIMDVLIAPGETQKYSLGISPNLKVLIQGKFDANLYIGAF